MLIRHQLALPIDLKSQNRSSLDLNRYSFYIWGRHLTLTFDLWTFPTHVLIYDSEAKVRSMLNDTNSRKIRRQP